MRKIIKNIIEIFYKPFLVNYLSSTRTYSYKGIVLQIPPQVFHPAFFFSTKLLLQYLQRLQLNGRKLLELGAGSGIVAMYASKQGAIVTASDVNSVAVDYLIKNSDANGIEINTILSDLFTAISTQQFDMIIINPPYYKKDPITKLDYAWYCGRNGEFFLDFFENLAQFIHPKSDVLMILSDGCDMAMISQIAAKNGYQLDCVFTKQNLIEKNFIFKIQPL